MFYLKINIRLFVIIPAVVCILSSCAAKGAPPQQEKKQEEAKKQIQYEVPKAEPVKPLKSGLAASLPWERDEKFLKAQKDLGVTQRMAAFQTVLRDPLPGEEYNVHLAAGKLAGTVVGSGEIFSQNRTLGPYTEERGFREGPVYIGTELKKTIGGGICKVASTLYNVTVYSNLEVMERHPHGMPVPYVPYGQDATVSYGTYDFKFRNNTGHPILIWSQGVDNVLYMAFYGKTAPGEVAWHHQTLETRKAPVIYRQNPALPAGSRKQVLEGMDGAVVKSWVTIRAPGGKSVDKQLGISQYEPMAFVIEQGK